MKFKCRLKVILAEKEMSHGEFAKAIGISASALSLIINNKSLPTFQVVYKICEELDMQIHEIWKEID